MERLEDINSYIEQLEIKTCFFGGFDKESAYLAIKELSHRYEEYIKELKTNLDASDARLAESRSQIEVSNKEIGELSKQNAVKDELIASQKTEAVQSKQKIEELENQMEAIRKDREEELTLKQEQKEAQKEQIARLKQLGKENVAYMEQIVQLEEDYKNAMSQVKRQNNQIEALKGQISCLEECNKASAEKINDLNKEVVKMKQEVENVTQIEEQNRRYLGNFYLDCLTKQTESLKDFFDLYKKLGKDLGELNENLTQAELRHIDLAIEKNADEEILHVEYEEAEGIKEERKMDQE